MFEDSRPRAPGGEEDAVCYEVFADGQDAARLEELRAKCVAAAAELTAGYIWQRDGFELRASAAAPPPWAPAAAGPPRLWGRTAFGDNVEDEWLVAWLLRELTRRHPGVAARAWDGDGEFLLIEAAYALPEWLSPEQAAERVWLRGGLLHLVPPPSAAQPGLPPQPSTAQALQILASPIETAASSQVQAALAARLADFPAKICGSMHHAAVLLPRRLAALLQADPQLLAPAVLAFHYRTPEDAKAAEAQAVFPLEDMCETSARFSRCLYAQLLTQQWQPPSGSLVPLPSDPAFPAAMLGLKLAAGFEMLAAAERSEEQGGLRDVEGAPEWQAHCQRLADAGHFGEARIGSAAHGQLLQQAAASFRQTPAYGQHRRRSGRPGQRLRAALQQPLAFDPAKAPGPPQSDAWLAEGAAEMEARLRGRQGGEGPEGPGLMQGAEELAERFKARCPLRLLAWSSSSSAGLARQAHRQPPAAAAAQRAHCSGRAGGAAACCQVPGRRKAALRAPGARWLGTEARLPACQTAPVLPSTRPCHTTHTRTLTHRCSNTPAQRRALPAARPQDFFGGEGGLEGADVEGGASGSEADAGSQAGGVDLDEAGLWRELQQALGAGPGEAGGSGGSGGAGPALDPWAEPEPDEGVKTATDSDDGGSAGGGDAAFFDAAYAEALRAELRSHAPQNSVNLPPTVDPTAPDLAAAGEDLEPIDLDMSLVQNLLASFSAQEGLPGPVGNLAGMMGLQLPNGRSPSFDPQ